MKRTVVFYETEKGQCPTAEFLDSTDEIGECRMVFGGNTYRLLCFFHSGSRVVLTNGFMKKTPKISADEISRAEPIKADYMRRHGGA